MKALFRAIVATHPADGHLVGGERARLVGADNRGAAQGLHGGKAADDGVLLRHATRAQGEAGGDDGGQALGDGGHSQGHGDLEVIDRPSHPGAAVDGVTEVADIDDPDGHADEGDDLGELLAKLVQLLLQRRFLLLGGHHLIADLADLCGDAGGDDDAYGTACSNVGALGKEKETGNEGLPQFTLVGLKDWILRLSVPCLPFLI